MVQKVIVASIKHRQMYFPSEKVNSQPAMIVARVPIIRRRSWLGLQTRLRWTAIYRPAALPTALCSVENDGK